MVRKSKWVAGILAAALLSAPAAGLYSWKASAAEQEIRVEVDGKAIQAEVRPRIVDGSTLVPFRAIGESLGGKVDWEQAGSKVTFEKDGTTVSFVVGSKTATVKGENLELEVAPINDSGNTLVPVRFVSEAFGKWVKWNGEQQLVSVDSTRTVQTLDGAVTLTQKPERVATVAQSDSEIVHALGGKLVARPNAAVNVFPPEAASLPEIGTSHAINFEKLATVNADLLLANVSNKKDVPTIESLGIQPILNAINSYDDTLRTIRLYGEVLGREEAAEALVQSLNERLGKLQEKQPQDKPKALVIFGAPGMFLVALPSSFSGNLLEQAGGANIAADFPPMQGYPQYASLSLERIVASNPDVIYLLSHGDPKAVQEDFQQEMKKNPTWQTLKAVKNDNLVVLPSDLFVSNPGPRVVDAIEYLQNTLGELK